MARIPLRASPSRRNQANVGAMRALLALCLAACAGSSASAPVSSTPVAAAARSFTENDRQAVAAVLADQSAAWNRGDLVGYMAGYLRSEALVFTSGSQVRTGYEETLASYQRKYGQAPDTMGKLAFRVLRIDPVGADGAVVLGRWDLERSAGKSGGIFSVVLERRPEGWRIVHDHTSSDPP